MDDAIERLSELESTGEEQQTHRAVTGSKNVLEEQYSRFGFHTNLIYLGLHHNCDPVSHFCEMRKIARSNLAGCRVGANLLPNQDSKFYTVAVRLIAKVYFA